MTELEIKEQMCEVGRRVYNKGMVAANDGNFSVKLNDHEFLCTPTGVSKGFMTPEFICKVDENANVLEANEGFRPSSEIKMHMRVYKERPDVKSVVHAHPMYATSFACCGTPSTDEIPDAVAEYLDYYDAVLLENHGALTYSDSLMNAYFKMESLEFYARLLYQAKMLGGPKELPEEQVLRLYSMRSQYGLTGRHPADKLKK